MAIYVNGIKVAGRGNSGKSPYMLAVEGGYTGTETEFNAELKAIGTAVSSVTNKIEECKIIVSNAQTSFNTIINNTRTELNTLIGTTTNDFNNLVANATTAATNASNSATLAQ